MNNPFEGKAVKFETSEQLYHLIQLAKKHCGFVCKSVFNLDYPYYAYVDSMCGYGVTNSTKGNTEIHYSDFVMNIEAQKFTDSITKDAPELTYEEKVVGMYPNSAIVHDIINAINVYKVKFGDKETGFYKTQDEAWATAYDMIVADTLANKPDPIARPLHYRKCSIEPIQIWRELSLNGFMGDALKYIMRLGHKDDKVKELTKCIQYLTWEIENIERGILQFTPKDEKCSVPADVIAKELGMSPFIHVALHVVLNLQNIEHKIPALQTAINCIRLEIINIEVSN